MFDWDDLKHFLAVARSGSTIAAAKVLGTSQSTVHRRLVELEARIGRRLIERAPTGYSLTKAGGRAFTYAERAEAAMAAFERQCKAADGDLAGTVRVTCTATLADRLAKSQLIDDFHARHPGLRVELLITHRVLDLSKGDADIALRIGTAPDDMLVGRKIMDVPRALYASHSYVERYGHPASSKDLAGHFVVAYEGPVARSAPALWLRSCAPGAIVAARIESWPELLATIKSGIGLGALPTYIGDCEAELVRLIDPAPELVTHLWLLVHPDLQHTPRVRAFLDYLAAEIKTLRALLLSTGAHSMT